MTAFSGDLRQDGRRLLVPAALGLLVDADGEFERSNDAISADLPERADPKTLSAKLANGVLTVTIKKRAESQPKQI